MAFQQISPQAFGQVLANGTTTLVDVRTPVEYREVHVQGAINLPLDQLAVEKLPNRVDGAPLYVICQKGGRSAQACQKLEAAGVANIVNIEGGTLACQAAGLPVEQGQKAMSLERQVRIAAGSLVLLGIGLSFVHPAWIGLSSFVAAGLVFAGISDTCGMGMMLARMPWNQVAGQSNRSTEVKPAA